MEPSKTFTEFSPFSEIDPRETVGREVINRFRMQFQAAAFASLEILSGKEVDRVYCDYHNDFVVRHMVNGVPEYHFFQVKTKGRANQQWKVDEVFSIKKRSDLTSQEDISEVRNSIAGKLFIHTIEFGDKCREVTLLSNVHFHDGVYEVIDHLKRGNSHKEQINNLIQKFGEIFSPGVELSESQLKSARGKFSLRQSSDIGDTLEPFANSARSAIWKYSEIDLSKTEVDEIAINLVTLVQSKSCEPIENLTKDSIDLVTSIGLDDLLKILSISTSVYEALVSGGDPAAIKVASILQRQLKAAGATEKMIEVASRAKVSWDVWVRNARHIYPEFDLELLLSDIDKKCREWILSGSEFEELRIKVNEVSQSEFIKRNNTPDFELLLGGFFSSVVRRASQ